VSVMSDYLMETLSPGEMLARQRERLVYALQRDQAELERKRAEVATLEARETKMLANLHELDAAMRRLRLVPVAPSEARQNNDAA
jgi:hypothetical protein